MTIKRDYHVERRRGSCFMSIGIKQRQLTPTTTSYQVEYAYVNTPRADHYVRYPLYSANGHHGPRHLSRPLVVKTLSMWGK